MTFEKLPLAGSIAAHSVGELEFAFPHDVQAEVKLYALPHFIMTIDGVNIHFDNRQH